MVETDTSKRGKKERTLTADAFARLLACLDTNQERAIEKYEKLRRSLTAFFAFRNLADPPALADETFNRVAFRLSEGQTIRTDNPASYFFSVAYNIWREQLAHPQNIVDVAEVRNSIAVQTPSSEALRAALEERLARENRLQCMEQCLTKLPAKDREILVEYHQGQGRSKIERRQSMASRLGITITTLRNRVCFIRGRTAACIQACLTKNHS